MRAPETFLTEVYILIDEFGRGTAIAWPNVRRRWSAGGFTSPRTRSADDEVTAYLFPHAGKSFMFVTVSDPSRSAPRG